MADGDLGTARGRIEIDSSGAEYGIGRARSSMDDFTTAQSRSADNMIRSGTVMIGAAAGIAAGFGLAINAAADFETRISGIAAVSGATGDELDAIREKALQLGADTKFSASEAAGAMEELIKAGLSVSDVMNGAADATVNLAAAGEIDLTTAATIAANAMNSFGLAAEELPHVADLIAGAANASAIDVGEFAQAMQQSAAVANLAGLSFDDLSVAIAAMGNAGIRGSDAGTSLKTFLSNLQPTTQRQIDLFRELGIVTEDGANQFYDAAGSLRPLNEISQTLQDSLAGMTDQQKQLTLETLFGSDAIRAAAVIAGEGAAGMDALAASMGEVTAQEVAETRMDNLAGSIEQLKGSVETLLIIIGRPLADALRVWVDRITDLVNWISGLDQSTLTMVTTIGQMVAAFAGAIGVILLVYGAFQKLKIGMAALNLIVRANPIGALLTLLIALGAALYMLYQKNETFREAVQDLFGWIADHVIPIIEAVKSAWDAFMGGFENPDAINNSTGWLSSFIDLGASVRDIVDTLARSFSEFWTVLTTGMTENEGGSWWENLAFFLRDEVLPVLQDVWGFVQRNFMPILIGLGVVVGLLVAPFATIAAAIVYAYMRFEVFRNVVSAVVGFVTGTLVPAIVWLGGKIAWLATEVAERLVSAFNWMREHVWPIFEALGELVVAIAGRVGEGVDMLIDFIDLLSPAFGGAFDVIMAIVGAAVAFLIWMWETFGNHIWEFIKIIWDTIIAVIEAALQIIQGIIEVVTGIISGDWSTVWEGIKDIVGGVWSGIQTVVGTAINIVAETIRTVLDTIRAIWDAAWGAMRSLLDTIWDGASAAFVGVINTILNALEAAINFTIDLVNSAIGALDSALGPYINFGEIGHVSIGNIGGGGSNVTPTNNGGGLRHFHEGGIFTLPGGGEGPAMLESGEGVLTVEQMGMLATLLRMVGMTMRSFFDQRAMLGSGTIAAPGSAGGSGGGIDLTMVFPNVGSAADMEEIKAALRDQNALAELSRSIKAGVGRKN